MVFRSKLSFLAWASARAKLLGELLLLSPTRDELAWARIVVLTHCATPAKPEIHPKQQPMHSHSIVNTTQPPKMQNRTQYRQNESKTGNPSLHYLERASNRPWHQIAKHSSFKGRFKSWKNSGIDLNEFIKTNPSWNHEE